MKLVIRQEATPDQLEKGQCIVYSRNDNSLGLILACPKCGCVATGTHHYDAIEQSLNPSVVCNAQIIAINEDKICIRCDYHGWLKNGVFTDV